MEELKSIHESQTAIKSEQNSLKQSIEKISKKLDGELKKVKKTISDIEKSLEYKEEQIQDINKAQLEIKKRQDAIEAKCESLQCLQHNVTNLQHKLTQQDTHNRKHNIIFDGINETTDEDCTTLIMDTLESSMGITNPRQQVKISRCHRNPPGPHKSNQVRPRGIMVCFQSYSDRTKVWKERFRLKGTGIWLNEDLPSDIQARHAQLLPIYKTAKAKNMQAFLNADRLTLDSKAFGIHNLHELPPELEAGQGQCNIEHGNLILFGNRTSVFSNFYLTSFTINGQTYNSAEQWYQYNKALYANDMLSCQQIISTPEPSKQYAIGKKVKADDKWLSEHARKVMKEGLTQKFTQNKMLKEIILNTKGKTLVECRKHDKVWGIGLNMKDPDAKDVSKWDGTNWLGICLGEVRDTI